MFITDKETPVITREEIIKQTNEALQKEFEFKPEQLVPAARLRDDLGLDSLDAVDMVVVLEQKAAIMATKKAPMQATTAMTPDNFRISTAKTLRMSRVVAPLILRTAISLLLRRLSSRIKPMRPKSAISSENTAPMAMVLRIFLLSA